MMRPFFIALLSFCFIGFLNGQCDNGQLQTQVHGEIENKHRHNNAFTYGMTSYQVHEDNFYYESAEDPAFYLGYGKSIWVGARDMDGNLRVAANTFPSLSRHDFIPGPLDRNTGQPIDTICGVYNRVWIVKQIDVFQMQVKFQQGELALEDIPQDILEWPAKGNPYLEEFSPDYDLAPFADIAEDGIYDPLSGDFPIALEENAEFVPHQFSFVVFNDMGRHTETNSPSLGMEFQQINYVVNCGDPSESEHSVFTRIKYNYLGQEQLNDVKIALWEDSDLACNQNDYEGCDRALNCTYFYNANGETFQGECHDPDVPDNNGAVRTTVFFNHEMKSFKHWFLLGVGDTLITGIDPTGAQEYYNYMSGLWRFQEPMTRGGNGFNPGSTDETLFAFPDRPNDPAGWSMQTAQLRVPLDGRALTTLINEASMMPGASGIIDFADHFLYDKVHKRLDVFNVWPDRVQAVKADFEAMKNGSFDCGGGLEICIDDCVWPGDANRDLAVTGKDFLLTGILAGYNLTDGIPRGFVSSEWFGFNADDWSASVGDINAKNGDVNGSGVINVEDLNAIAENIGNSRPGYVSPQNLVMKEDPQGLRVELEVDTVNLETALLFDKIVNTNITFGDDNENIGTPIHGLSFDMRFDTNLVRPFVKLDEIFSNVFQYNFATLANQGREGNVLVGDDKIQYAYTNYNGNEITKGGLLANQNLFVRDDAVTRNANGIDTLVIRFFNGCAVDVEGNEVELGAVNDTLIITGLMVDPDLISSTAENIIDQSPITVYPNPATELLNINFEEEQTGVVEIFNVSGQLLSTNNVYNKSQLQIDLKKMPDGLKILQFINADGKRSIDTFVKL